MKKWQWAVVKGCVDFSSHPMKLRQLTQLVKMTVGISGPKIRLTLANRYGQQPLRFDRLLIATNQQMSGAVKVPFKQRTHFTIPAGQTVVSDPVSLTVVAGQPLYVLMVASRPQVYADVASTYDPRLINAVYSQSTVMVPLLPNGFQKRKSWFCLEGCEVLSADEPLTIELTGDSLAEMGLVATPLAKQLHQRSGQPVVVINTGISGSRLLYDAPADNSLAATFGASLLHRLANDRWATKVIVALAGSNDLVLPLKSRQAYLPTADQFIHGVDQLAQVASRQERTLVMTTIPPFDLHLPSSQRAARQHVADFRCQLNRCLLALPFVVNIEPLVAANGRLSQQADFGDQLHYSRAGANLVASAICQWIDDKIPLSET